MHQPKPLIFLGISGVFVFRIDHCRKSVETSQRAKAHSIHQMIRCQVGITHGHSQVGVPEDLLQGQDVPAVLNEVAGKGMTQAMPNRPIQPEPRKILRAADLGG